MFDDWELNDDLPEEEIFFVNVVPPWEMFFDGVAQWYGVRIRILLVSPKKHILTYSFVLVNLCFNNVTEYQALVLGLQMVIGMGIKDLDVEMATGRVGDGEHTPCPRPDHSPPPVPGPFPIAGKKVIPILVPGRDLIPNGASTGNLPHHLFLFLRHLNSIKLKFSRCGEFPLTS